MDTEKVKPLKLRRERAPRPTPSAALEAPIATVLVDSGLLHLDQEFDFLIPHEFSEQVKFGSLVKVPFNKGKTLGVVTGRKASSEFHGQLRFISEVIPPFPIVLPTIMKLAEQIKNYYGGTRWDSLRFAIPAFNKQKIMIESAEVAETPSQILVESDSRYPAGFWQAINVDPKVSAPVRVFWSAPPVDDPFTFIASLTTNPEFATSSTLILMPDSTDVDRMAEKIRTSNRISGDSVLVWHSEMRRSEREATFLKVLNNKARVIVGVRGALLLPIQNLRLIFFWDEANESYVEKRAPYFHAREVAIMKSHIERSHIIFGGFSPSITLTSYLQKGYLTHLRADPTSINATLPKVRALSNQSAPDQAGSIPTLAWQVAKRGLQTGPVLFLYPTRGYIQTLSCRRCLNQATCACGGKLIWRQERVSSECNLCGSSFHNWRCPFCNTGDFRHVQLGDQRIAEVLGKAFPNTKIISSNVDHRVYTIGNEPALVVSTPGAEPRVNQGYSAIVILNSRIFLGRAALNAEEQTRRQWFEVAAMLRKRGEIFIDVEDSNRNLHALLRWDCLTIAIKEYEERKILSLPPAAKAIQVSGVHDSVRQIVANLPPQVLISQPRIDRDESVSLLRIVGPDQEPIVQEIFQRARNQSAKGMPVARIAIDPDSL